jgi:fibronectin-binding autotransporter adhesin
VLALTAVETAAAAPPGSLVQPPGSAGCFNDVGTRGCAKGRAVGLAYGVALSPDGRNAYVASLFSDAIAVFARDARTGELRQLSGKAGCVSQRGKGPCAFGRALGGASSVVVSPDGANVYVAADFSHALVVLARNKRTGALRQLSGSAGCISNFRGGGCKGGRALAGPEEVAISADGGSVYVASTASDAVAVFSRNPTSGAVTQASDARGCVSLEGRWGCTPARGLDKPLDVALSPDGRNLYVASYGSDAVAVFSRGAGGSLSQAAGPGGCISQRTAGGCSVGRALGGATALAVTGRSVYVASYDSDAVAILTRGGSGVLSQPGGPRACVSQAGGGGCAEGRALDGAQELAVSPDGRNLYVAAAELNALAVFARATNGGLSQLGGRNGCFIRGGVAGCAHGRVIAQVSGIAISRNGRNVYLAASGSYAAESDGLAIFRRNR